MKELLHFLPERPQPAYVRYVVSALMAALSGLLALLLFAYSGQVFYFVFLPAIYLAGIMFDRGSGFLATGIAVLMCGYLLWPMADRIPEIVSLILFCLLGVGTAFASEGMRKLLERTRADEQEKTTSFLELVHRTKNNLMSIASLLMMQSRAASSQEAAAALALAADRVNVIADVHNFLSATGDHRVSMQKYLEELCHKVGYTARGVRPIAVRVDAEDVRLLERKAVPIGIIVNELITNCFKYAFPDGRVGEIAVRLRAAENNRVVLEVADDGVGCPKEVRPGLGTRLVELMARQLGGSMERLDVEGGCLVRVSIPLRQR